MADINNPTGTDLYTAQSAISQMLAPEEDTAATTDALQAEEEVIEEVTEDEAEMSEDAEGYSEGDLDEGDEYEEGDDDQSFDVLSATVDVDGEEITVEELKRGHLRQRDYTRKTQALAEERQVLESKMTEIERERAQYAQLLPQLKQRIEMTAEQEPDWDTLYDADPQMAAKAERQWRKQQEQRTAQLQAVEAEQQRLQELHRQQQDQLRAQYLDQQRQVLPEVIPEWRDSKVAAKEASDLRGYLINEGFSEQDVDGLSNAMLVKIARKAMLFDKGAKNVQAAKAKPKGSKAKTLKAGSRGSQPRPKSERTRAQQQAQQTGRVADAAMAIKALL
jgi:hypothetical protein